MINTKQISFIVQGPVNKDGSGEQENSTSNVLKRIRSLFPDSQIIFSTWDDQVVDSLDYNELVQSTDPHKDESKVNKFNINRQVLGIKNALSKVDREYIVKTRSDLLIPSSDFLSLYNEQLAMLRPKYFDQPVLITRYFTKKFAKMYHVAFHFSDWFQFGSTKSIKRLWDIPLTKEPEFGQYLKGKGLPLDVRYSPEQYPWINALKDVIPKTMDHMFSYDRVIEDFEIELLKNDIIFWDNEESGLKLDRYSNFSKSFEASLFDSKDFSLLKSNQINKYRLRRKIKRLLRF